MKFPEIKINKYYVHFPTELNDTLATIHTVNIKCNEVFKP
jgi:hypothetical protein